jgi:hypothetical protein
MHSLISSEAAISSATQPKLILRLPLIAQDDSGYLANVSALFRRALRRFAVLRWIIPRLAALSIAEIAARISCLSGFGAERICFCSLRS